MRNLRSTIWVWISFVCTILAQTAHPGESQRTTETSPATIDFATQIIPVFTRVGCNSGACHGAAIGRGGFKLSLLGYDPQSDYENLVNEFEGRRVNRVHPEKSLVLRKPSMDVDHEGGLRLQPGDDGFRILQEWIAAGAPRETRRRLVRLDVSPKSQWLEKLGDTVSVRVLAHFEAAASDQQSVPARRDNQQFVEDVTRWAVFTAADPAALDVSPRGEVTARRRGQNTVTVRFLGEVAAVTVTVPITDATIAGTRPRANFVDDHVNRTLDELRLPHSPRAGAATLARRIYLDLIGTLPEPHEVEEFAAASPDARTLVVERLMDRPEFVDHWSYKWGDLLRIESRRLQPAGAAAFHRWVRECVAQNTPLDVMAREMLLTLGDAHRVGPANFSRVPTDARTQAEHVSRVFMGVRLQCANCHNHPLDRWTQDDYHGLAAIFARTDRGREVKLLPRGDVIHPKTGQPAAPRIPGERFLSTTDGGREQLASWLTLPDNPFFARAAVNRIWRELMGRGLVEPIDDHRTTNPATHPELLDALARDLVAHGFDVRHTIRTIVASEAYRRGSLSVVGNGSDDRFYSKALVRPLPPHVLVDAVAMVTGVAEQFGELPAGTRAISLADSRVPSQPLDLLGRCSRDAECSPAASAAGSLPLTLHTINGPWLNAKIGDPTGRLARLLESETENAEVVTELYSIAFARRPTSAELAHWQRKLEAAGIARRAATLEDFLWALLNSAEFCCNH